jgi:hypothetical protein
MSEFSLFIRNQAKEAERKLKVQFTLCAATVFLLVLRWMFLCCGHPPSPTQPYVWLHVKAVVLVHMK